MLPSAVIRNVKSGAVIRAAGSAVVRLHGETGENGLGALGVWDAFLVHSYSETFWIPRLNPRGWLYSRSVENLFWAHRPVRARRDAPVRARVIYSGRLMGEAAGFAAKLCRDAALCPGGMYRMSERAGAAYGSSRKSYRKRLRSAMKVRPDRKRENE